MGASHTPASVTVFASPDQGHRYSSLVYMHFTTYRYCLVLVVLSPCVLKPWDKTSAAVLTRMADTHQQTSVVVQQDATAEYLAFWKSCSLTIPPLLLLGFCQNR